MSKKGLSMRVRRVITLGVLASLVTTGFLAFGPRLGDGTIQGIPEAITQWIPDTKPVSIFDPPKYSLDRPKSLWVVVNKQRPLKRLKYKPKELTFPNFENPATQNPFSLQLRSEAALAVTEMAIAMKEAGKGELILNSGFRSYKTQAALYERTKAQRGFEIAEKLSARPGYSEHQTGLAADFSAVGQGCSIMVCFGKTDAGTWLRKNAHKYGFILRYPAKYSEVTGFQYEPWHFRFVGVELATEMKKAKIKTLEEFFGLDAAPNYPAAG
jgi:zinc D-Ala-D-Ala carboxypeptidase